ncbi:MAG: hypothetical protein KDA80_05670 [Planctomycetaceae bacterium]|nr:hypothetical protein [Planctomycetaceae bacterium]
MVFAGVGRTEISPFPGVELTGWGYYIERVWQRVHDPLHATALVCESGSNPVVLITLDLMLIDAKFTARVREQLQARLGLPPVSIMLTCSHSHNAPAAGGLRGVGECDPKYEAWAAEQAVAAAIMAWEQREPVGLKTTSGHCAGLTFNRTRPVGLVDDLLTVASFQRVDGTPLAVLANFAAHPTVTTDLRPFDVSRDVPGQVCDLLEEHFPGALAMYVQGACGDTNFLREFQTDDRYHEPAARLAETAIQLLTEATESKFDTVCSSSRVADLPTRRWTLAEIQHDRDEAQRRLETEDFSGWRETIGRSMTNRPDDMVTRHGGDEAKAVRAMCRFHLEWTDEILRDLETREEILSTEVQTLRIGDLHIVANSSEFFSPFALDVRDRANVPALMMACYSNGRIGYLPDEYDINARSYAGFQSPKYCNQFPFTADSGPVMCDAMVATIADCQSEFSSKRNVDRL